MSNRPIVGMTAISVSDRIGLLREALINGVARAVVQKSNDGLPTFDDIMQKYFPELFAEPLVPGKDTLIKAGEVFTLSVMSVPEYNATTYVAKQDFDLRQEYQKQLVIRREEAERNRDNYGDEDREILEHLFGVDAEYSELNLECALSDMSQRLKETGVIELFQCRVHHLSFGAPEKRTEDLEDFFKGHWRNAEGYESPRPE